MLGTAFITSELTLCHKTIAPNVDYSESLEYRGVGMKSKDEQGQDDRHAHIIRGCGKICIVQIVQGRSCIAGRSAQH